MRRAPGSASPSPLPLSFARLRCGWMALALLALLALLASACADRTEPPLSREPAPPSASAPVPDQVAVTAPSVASAVASAPGRPEGSTAGTAEPDPSVKKPVAAIDVPRPLVTSTLATAVPTASPVATTVPSALASAAPSVIPAVPPAPPVPVAPPIESPKVAEASFNLWMQGAGKYKAGQPGAVQIVLVALGAFHCNDKYSHKFKLGAPPPGVSYPQPIVRVESMVITPARSVMTVPFVPSAPGDARISGTFTFSVCSASSCLLETRELAINVKVD